MQNYIFPESFLGSYIEVLKQYKVDNAIIMAAGLSSRFAPLSYEKPKGLYGVKGEILIEREIEQLKSAEGEVGKSHDLKPPSGNLR